MSRIKFLIRIASIAVIIAILMSFFLARNYINHIRHVMSKPISNQEYIVTIPPSASLPDVVMILNHQGINVPSYELKVFLYLKQWHRSLKAGTYKLEARENWKHFFYKINQGKVVHYKITFVEGLTWRAWLSQIESSKHLQHELKFPFNESHIIKQLGINEPFLEGKFYPETYDITDDTKDITLLKRAYKRMKLMLHSNWQKRGKLLGIKTKDEALILASIIEKESRYFPEYKKISGVMQRRLAKGIKLQIDATVRYGVRKWTGFLTRSDLRHKTPYNTYLYKGLPPTPISCPGEKAITAALHPQAGDEYYFVVGTDNPGKHVFSKTLREHRKKVAAYHRSRKKK
jgi:UPF0755 protein